jgi:hypothetical protein
VQSRLRSVESEGHQSRPRRRLRVGQSRLDLKRKSSGAQDLGGESVKTDWAIGRSRRMRCSRCEARKGGCRPAPHDTRAGEKS